MRIFAVISTDLDHDPGVERDASGDVIAFRLFRAGRFETDHGTSIFDDEAARVVLEERARRGNRYALDFDHLSINPTATPEQRRAAGSFDIELRGGELWAVDLRLTEEARAFVRAGHYLSVSPTWEQDPETGRVLGFVNCALTSNPATHGAVRLAASRTGFAMRGPASIPTDVLRITAAKAPSRALRDQAAKELARRGEQITDPESPEGRRLATMRTNAGLPSSEPIVRHIGAHTFFRTLTPEEARAYLAARVRR